MLDTGNGKAKGLPPRIVEQVAKHGRQQNAPLGGAKTDCFPIRSILARIVKIGYVTPPGASCVATISIDSLLQKQEK